MLTDKHYETIMDCLDEFDFNRVHTVMVHLNWLYSDCKDVPTVEYLRKNARKYLIAVATEALKTKSEYITGTGGFRYEAKLYENGLVDVAKEALDTNTDGFLYKAKHYEEDFLWLRIAFEIESWDNAE